MNICENLDIAIELDQRGGYFRSVVSSRDYELISLRLTHALQHSALAMMKLFNESILSSTRAFPSLHNSSVSILPSHSSSPDALALMIVIADVDVPDGFICSCRLDSADCLHRHASGIVNEQDMRLWELTLVNAAERRRRV